MPYVLWIVAKQGASDSLAGLTRRRLLSRAAAECRPLDLELAALTEAVVAGRPVADGAGREARRLRGLRENVLRREKAAGLRCRVKVGLEIQQRKMVAWPDSRYRGLLQWKYWYVDE